MLSTTMKSRIVTTLWLLLGLFVLSSHSFHIRPSSFGRSSSHHIDYNYYHQSERNHWTNDYQRLFSSSDEDDTNNDKQEEIFFNDFDFPIGGEKASDLSQSSKGEENRSLLQERVTQLVTAETELRNQISQNWKDGHWSVRGCSLDPGDAGFGENRIHISALLALPDNEDDSGDYHHQETILVGRTDGSIVWLQLGSEYLASFTRQLVAEESSNETISVQEQLQKDETTSITMPRQRLSESETAKKLSDQASSTFDILGQIQAVSTSSSSAAVVDMAVVQGGDGTSNSVLYVLSQSPTEPLKQFLGKEDNGLVSSSIGEVIQVPEQFPIQSPIVVLKAIRYQYAITINQNGFLNVWQPKGSTSILKSSCSIPLEDDDSVLSCDVDNDFIYVGTSIGTVFIYSIDKLLNSDDETTIDPLKSLIAFANGGVSSICAAGEGVMGKGRETATVALAAGSTLGEIKQWEVLPRGTDAVEYWPKIPSQTMPGKAHLLVQGGTYSMAEATPQSAVIALTPVQDGVLLSATQDQIIIWNTVTGRPFCDMHGLSFIPQANCLVFSERFLVTNGMQQYVCVHDFSIDPNIDIQDMIQHMDDEDE